MNNKNQNRRTVDEMINHIAKEDNLLHFLSKNNIADIDEVNDIQRYERDGNRIGLIIDVKEKNVDARVKIMIDLKQGQPIINQVYDSLYGIGKDCDIKILINSSGHNDYDNDIPSANVWAVLSLIAQLQQKNVPILLCEMDENTSKIKYVDLAQNWYRVDRSKTAKIPTREHFMVETFLSVYFDSFNVAFYDSLRAYSDGFRDTNDWGYSIYIDCSLNGELKLYWDENGVRYEIKQCNDSDEYLKKVLDVYMPALKDSYGEDAVRFENVVGRLPRLYIKYSDQPFQWLYSATPRQIMEFADKMVCDAWGLRRKIDEAIEKLYKTEPALV